MKVRVGAEFSYVDQTVGKLIEILKQLPTDAPIKAFRFEDVLSVWWEEER